jgi:bifunctional non-homologous end joining protein LigD
MLRELLGKLGLEAWPKSSGSKGMQVYVPLNTPTSYEQTKPFAHAIAQLLERREPKLVLSEMARAKRGGRVFVDWSQNTRHKTTVNVYSLRARERAHGVDAPLRWEEVEAATESREPEDLALHLRRGARARGRARGPVRPRARAPAGVACSGRLDPFAHDRLGRGGDRRGVDPGVGSSSSGEARARHLAHRELADRHAARRPAPRARRRRARPRASGPRR